MRRLPRCPRSLDPALDLGSSSSTTDGSTPLVHGIDPGEARSRLLAHLPPGYDGGCVEFILPEKEPTMVQLKADQDLGPTLVNLKERVEVLDAEGRLLGYFTPVESEADIVRRKAFAAYESGEYQRRKAMSEGKPGYTTAQVLAHLRSLGTP
jgi:hypothetical protein